jgi:adenosylcobinamide amidohydrolase
MNDIVPEIPDTLTWDSLFSTPLVELSRNGRFLKAELRTPHLVLSTSAKNGGQRRDLRFLVNHQSCEAKDHVERQQLIKGLGLPAYHDAVCHQIGIDPSVAAVMGTAANMNYAAITVCQDGDLEVRAVVTAGVQGNACCAGDPAAWREVSGEWVPVHALAGTINTMVFINKPVTEGALARAAITMAEAKSAALTRLAVASLYSQDLATGTGTDQFCIAAACMDTVPLTSASQHVVLGELIGRAVRDATLEALRWQNGMEPSYTRSVFHALGRYGLKESEFFERIAPFLSERILQLMQQNAKAIIYEPMLSASAYAIAAILDRVRYETLPASIARAALRQQAASLAAGLAAKPERWAEFHAKLPEADASDPIPLVLAAIALGWTAKWT